MADVVDLLTADLVTSLIGGDDVIEWGIFKDGFIVLEPDSFLALDMRQDWSVPDYPIEDGSFENYNKVQLPFATRVRMAVGDEDPGAKQEFLAILNQIADDTELYDVVTPDEIYESVNIVHKELRRSNVRGASMLLVDIWLQQIRVSASSQFSKTKDPSGSDTVNAGTVNTSDSNVATTPY